MLFSILKTFGRVSSRGLGNLVTSGVAKTSLSRVTGRGPFIDNPSFEIVGDSCAVLSIRVPESSLLCLNNTSILVLNGKMADINSNPFKISASIWGQHISPRLPTSIVMASANLRYHITQLGEGETWYLSSADTLVGWHGCSIRTSSSGLSEMGSQNISLKGPGAFVVKDTNNFLTIEIRAGEQVSVNTASIIASNVSQHCPDNFSIKKLQTPFLHSTLLELLLLVNSAKSILTKIINLSQLNFHSSLGNSTHNPAIGLLKSFSKLSTDIQHWWRKLFYRSYKKGTFCEFEGPAKIILRSSLN